MTTDLNHEDAEAIATTLRRFLREVVAPHLERPEHRLTESVVAAMTAQARELGLLNLDADEGCGLWEAADLPGARRHTLRSLRLMAQVNAGIALHFHQLALGAWLGRRLNRCDGTPTSFDLFGSYGMGRALLPRWLRAGALTAGDRDWLAAYFEPSVDSPRLLQLGSPTEAVWFARYDAASDTLGFERVAVAALEGPRLGTSHGLDETQTLVVAALPRAGSRLVAHDDPRGDRLYRTMLELHSLGLCAIGVGVQQHSVAKAAEYAELRVQGGTTIVHHAAVQHLLGRARAAAASGEALIEGLSQAALTAGSLTRSLAARASVFVEGCAAANDALQVFGGIGYMRDTGVEKLVRDQNHLRVFWGSPPELRRAISELERTA